MHPAPRQRPCRAPWSRRAPGRCCGSDPYCLPINRRRVGVPPCLVGPSPSCRGFWASVFAVVISSTGSLRPRTPVRNWAPLRITIMKSVGPGLLPEAATGLAPPAGVDRGVSDTAGSRPARTGPRFSLRECPRVPGHARGGDRRSPDRPARGPGRSHSRSRRSPRSSPGRHHRPDRRRPPGAASPA